MIRNTTRDGGEIFLNGFAIASEACAVGGRAAPVFVASIQ